MGEAIFERNSNYLKCRPRFVSSSEQLPRQKKNTGDRVGYIRALDYEINFIDDPNFLAWQNSAKGQTALVFGASDFKKGFRNAAADAGLFDVHFYDLRHTAVTRMLERGISPPLVMKISGHTQQMTFLRYVNQSETSIREIAEQLDAAAFASASPAEVDRIKIFKTAHSKL